MSFPISNRLLDALSVEERTPLLSQLERVAIPARATLFNAERIPRYMYLLTSGVASIVSEMNAGQAVEVSMVGREGIPGSCRLLGSGMGHSRCVMLEAGTGLRMEFRKFEQAFQMSPGLHKLVLQHVQHEAFMMEQLSACNRVHETEARLSRWLLMASDRVGDVLLNPTQESMSKTLGTRRTTITQVASGMQRRGLIRYRRGRMQILDRDGLRESACECYPVTQRALQTLYDQAPVEAAPPAPAQPWKQPSRMPSRVTSFTPRFA